MQLDVGKVADLSPLEALSKLKTITLTNYRGQKIPDMEACTHLNIEAVEHIGNALGHGLGIEVYDCVKEQKLRATGVAGDTSSYRWSAPLSAVLGAH